MANKDQGSIRCSFCGKSQNEVNRMIAGNGAYICDECVRLCLDIVEEYEDEDPITGAPKRRLREKDPKKAAEAGGDPQGTR